MVVQLGGSHVSPDGTLRLRLSDGVRALGCLGVWEFGSLGVWEFGIGQFSTEVLLYKLLKSMMAHFTCVTSQYCPLRFERSCVMWLQRSDR